MTMTRYSAITTCSKDQWNAYGRAMATTFVRHWPAEVILTVYAEGFRGEDNGRVRFVDLDEAAPWLSKWKAQRSVEQHGGPQRNFRYDAVRFSHKVAAIGAATETTNAAVTIWLDADTVTHAPVTVEWLDSLLPLPADVAWLDRATKYPECGFLMFRLPSAREVIQDIVTTYQTGAIFRFAEWHDSWIIWKVVEAAVARGEIKVTSLSGDGRNLHHPFAVGPLGARLDHLKGGRKAEGRSRPTDFPRPRSEPYWR
jgi:hypothetical protein